MSTTYAANFQREREVNATRIKDTLYIFNGTYPVYYKGDGKLYLFPEHQTTYEELVVSGHNTMMDDFNSYYYPSGFKELERPQEGQFTIKDFDFYPKVPFQFKSEGVNEDQLKIRLTYNYEDEFDNNVVSLLPSNYFGKITTLMGPLEQGYSDLVGQVIYFEGTENFYTPDPLGENPDPLGRVPEGWKIVDPTEENGFKKYYEASVKVYTRPTTFAETSEWIEIDNLNVDADVLGNKPFGIDQFQGIETPYNIKQNTKYFNSLSYLDVTVNNITSGLRDIKVEVTVSQIGFAKDTSSASSPYAFFPVKILNKVYKKEEIELEGLNITPERLQDFPLDIPGVKSRGGFTLRAPWSCNQVIEHYGKLIVWGSEDMPYTAFVSAVDQYNYFPYNYTIDFNTDFKESINSIVPFMNILVVQSDSYTWGIKGNTPQITIGEPGDEEINPNAYEVITINASVGSIAPKAVRPIRNRLYFLSQEGLMELTSLFATDDRYNVKPVDRNISNLIPQDREAVAIQFDNQYWINFPSTGQTFRYYIDKQAWVKDSFNFDTFNGIYRYYNKNGKLHFITNPMVIDSGNLEIYEGVIDYSLATDFDKSIKSQFLTSKMNQEYPFHWKKYKELKIDFTVQNEYIPDLDSVEILSTDTDVPYTITANFEPNHRYALSLNITPTYDENEEEYIYPVIQGLTVQGAINPTSVDSVIYFTVGNVVPEEVTVSFSGATVEMFDGIVLTDETYDKNLAFNINIVSDNNSLIRGVDVSNSYYDNELALISDELGVMANTFEDIFENSQFGKAYKFVHTNKLYGSGYDLEMYYEDSSKVKWTLETIGVTYKMRRTRSR